MNFEKMKKVANNGSVKFLEKLIALVGIPIILLFLSWMGSTLVEVGEEVTSISVRQQEVILPKLEKLETEDFIKRAEFQDSEERIGSRFNRIENRIYNRD